MGVLLLVRMGTMFVLPRRRLPRISSMATAVPALLVLPPPPARGEAVVLTVHLHVLDQGVVLPRAHRRGEERLDVEHHCLPDDEGLGAGDADMSVGRERRVVNIDIDVYARGVARSDGTYGGRPARM